MNFPSIDELKTYSYNQIHQWLDELSIYVVENKDLSYLFTILNNHVLAQEYNLFFQITNKIIKLSTNDTDALDQLVSYIKNLPELPDLNKEKYECGLIMYSIDHQNKKLTQRFIDEINLSYPDIPFDFVTNNKLFSYDIELSIPNKKLYQTMIYRACDYGNVVMVDYLLSNINENDFPALMAYCLDISICSHMEGHAGGIAIEYLMNRPDFHKIYPLQYNMYHLLDAFTYNTSFYIASFLENPIIKNVLLAQYTLYELLNIVITNHDNCHDELALTYFIETIGLDNIASPDNISVLINNEAKQSTKTIFDKILLNQNLNKHLPIQTPLNLRKKI